jgi:hypothetical protein
MADGALRENVQQTQHCVDERLSRQLKHEASQKEVCFFVL